MAAQHLANEIRVINSRINQIEFAFDYLAMCEHMDATSRRETLQFVYDELARWRTCAPGSPALAAWHAKGIAGHYIGLVLEQVVIYTKVQDKISAGLELAYSILAGEREAVESLAEEMKRLCE